MAQQLSFEGFEPPPSAPLDPVFFALLPDREAQGQIDAVAQALAREHRLTGRRTALDRLHVSLCGVRWPRDKAAKLVPLADSLARRASLFQFEASFDRALSLKSRSGNYPLVLASRTGEILDLHRLLQGRLARAVGGEEHGKIMPHITMLYDPAMVLEQAIEPVTWTVRELVLIHSLRGLTRHVILGRWPLDG
jgi:2'-5' RNA ligase